MAAHTLEDYIHLIEAFTTRKTSAAEFEREYLQLFKEDNTQWPDAQFQVLDTLFADVDAYCADPKLRDEDDLDEEALRSRAEAALSRLRALSRVTPSQRRKVIGPLRLPELRQAAAKLQEPLENIRGPDFEVYTHEGRRILWIEVKWGTSMPTGVLLHLKGKDRSGQWRYPIEDVDLSNQTRGLYVVLGTPEELRHAAAQALGELPGTNEPFHLEIELEFPDGEDAASPG